MLFWLHLWGKGAQHLIAVGLRMYSNYENLYLLTYLLFEIPLFMFWKNEGVTFSVTFPESRGERLVKKSNRRTQNYPIHYRLKKKKSSDNKF